MEAVGQDYNDQDNLILGRYRPISQAGSGGYATVIAAWDTRIQRRVAIKMMQLEPDDSGPQDKDVARAGLEEARTAAMLQDANIVGVYDFEVHNGTAYLIMEYIDGITLTQLMRNWGDYMNVDIVAAVFQGVAHALEVAHDNQVLHLDIKPDNVLIDRKGQVKVTDFGLSRLSDAAGFAHAGGGTIGYMPLEQMRLESLDARCDEWALASITYQMLTGENPFLAQDLPRAQKAIEDAELVLPSLCMTALPEEADDVLFDALAPNRERRYATVREFAADMQPLLGNPSQGRKLLSRIVGKAREDMPEDQVVAESATPVQTEGRPMKEHHIPMRLWSLVGSGLLAFVSLANNTWLDGITSLPLWGIWVVVAVLAVLVPHVGAALSVAAFAVTLVSQGYYVFAAVLVVAGFLWWFFVARDAMAQANSGLGAVVFGAVGLGTITPLAAGYFLNVSQAAVTTLFSSLLAILLAAFGSGTVEGWWPHLYWNNLGPGYTDALVAVLSNPTTWITIASWVLAAMVMAALCGFGSRPLACLGAVLAGVLLAAGVVGCTWVESGFTTYIPSTVRLAIPVACAVVAAIVGAVRAPDVD